MKLRELIKGLEVLEVTGSDKLSITSVTDDSRKVERGSLFVARKGLNFDGHNFVADAVQKGASAVVCEYIPEGLRGITIIRVADSAKALAYLTSKFWGEPAKKMRVVGITGTNGKTSTTILASSALNEAGRKSFIMGTLGVGRFDEKSDSRFAFESRGLTSPDPPTLHSTFKQLVEESAEYVLMEASSHAIHQKRLDFVPFPVRVFTNLSQDHLDYHKSMDEYAKVKRSFFFRKEFGQLGCAVICIDDELGKRLIEEVPATTISFGFSDEACVKAEICELSLEGSRFKLCVSPEKVRGDRMNASRLAMDEIEIEVESKLVGRHNALNVAAAFAVALSEGVEPHTIADGISKVKKVPGRLESVENDRGIYVFVDYAHTPDALEKVLKALRELAWDRRIICVFGCGGDRDRSKRPLMAIAAANHADAIIITNDNPRSEDPEQIAEDILRGLSRGRFRRNPKYTVELDRRLAIEIALHDAREGEVVLIAGKGHEDYQIFKDRTIHFSDVEVTKEILAGQC